MDTSSESTSLLAIGGLDPTGGAGLLLDSAAARSMGVHCAGICTISTVQNGQEFVRSRIEDPQFVTSSIEAVFSTMNIGAVKTGALGSGETIRSLSALAAQWHSFPLIIDPVIRSSSGGALLDDSGIAVLKDGLMRHATLVTPNLPEAEILTDTRIADADGMLAGALKLLETGAKAILIKGGHLDGDDIIDVFVDNRGAIEVFSSQRIKGESVRGTGCALASTIASLMIKGHDLHHAVKTAREIVGQKIQTARRLGSGPPLLFF